MDWRTITNTLAPPRKVPFDHRVTEVKALSRTGEVLSRGRFAYGADLGEGVGLPVELGGTVTDLDITFGDGRRETITVDPPRPVRHGDTFTVGG